MNFKAQIAVHGETEAIIKLFLPETHEFENGRAKYSLNPQPGGVLFEIEATDSSALRAVLMSITKLLTVYEKTLAVKNGQANTSQN